MRTLLFLLLFTVWCFPQIVRIDTTFGPELLPQESDTNATFDANCSPWFLSTAGSDTTWLASYATGVHTWTGVDSVYFSDVNAGIRSNTAIGALTSTSGKRYRVRFRGRWEEEFAAGEDMNLQWIIYLGATMFGVQLPEGVYSGATLYDSTFTCSDTENRTYFRLKRTSNNTTNEAWAWVDEISLKEVISIDTVYATKGFQQHSAHSKFKGF